MNEPVTLQQVLLTALGTVIAALAPQIYNIYVRYRDSKDKEREMEAAKEEREDSQKLTETEKLYREWENVANGYIRQIESLRHLEVENAALRPLQLKIALVQQENKQLKDDKEDWKDYSDRLARQLESMNVIPLPFRRTPRDGDTLDKIRPIKQKFESVQEDIATNTPTDTIIEAVRKSGDARPIPASTDTPTKKAE